MTAVWSVLLERENMSKEYPQHNLRAVNVNRDQNKLGEGLHFFGIWQMTVDGNTLCFSRMCKKHLGCYEKAMVQSDTVSSYIRWQLQDQLDLLEGRRQAYDVVKDYVRASLWISEWLGFHDIP